MPIRQSPTATNPYAGKWASQEPPRYSRERRERENRRAPGGETGGTVGTLITTTSIPVTAALPVSREHAERIEAAAAEVLSVNTRRAYATAWRAWSAWCASEDVEPLTAQPLHVAAYLAERAEAGAGISTLRTAVAAIAHEHASRGATSPAIHPGVRRVLRGLARRQASTGRTPRQAAALTGEALAAIRATAHRPRTGPGGRPESADRARRRGDMDIAIASVMRDALLRRSEAAALTWADLERRPDGTGRLTVRRSKGDQAGEGAELFLGRDAMAALDRIRPEPAALAAPVFGGLDGRCHRRPYPQGCPGRRPRGPLFGALPPHRHGSRPRGVGRQHHRANAGRTLAYRAHACPLCPWRARRQRPRRSLLRRRVGAESPSHEHRHLALQRATLDT